VTNWLINGNEPVLAHGAGQRAEGCAFAADQSQIQTDLTIPTVDYYGNSTLGSGTAPYTLSDYQLSEIWGHECNNGSRPAALNLATLAKSGDACVVGLASWNAADMAGKQIRADATLSPVIYTLGYQGNAGGKDDPVLMRRLSNIKGASTVYDATRPEGLYLPIANINDITPAFQRVLSEILRLTL
jgi:hypothetical protein